MVWTELPQGKDVPVNAGYFYAAVAMVKSDHAPTTITEFVAKKGLQIIDYQDPVQDDRYPADSGYRVVAIQAVATKDVGTLPWSLPFPLSMFDSSRLLHVWVSPKEASESPTPAAVSPHSRAGWWLLGSAAAAGGILWWLHVRRKAA